MPFESKVDEPEFRRLLLQYFPEVADEIEDDAGLVHLEMASLERLANQAIQGGDFITLRRVYEFISDMARHRSEVDPTVINAIHVSFLEGLNFGNKANGDEAKRLLPSVLVKMWEAQMEHNRKIGWMK
ncbi:MAG: hypothetical protein AAFX44_01940 [Pseudomonadota bacterium]